MYQNLDHQTNGMCLIQGIKHRKDSHLQCPKYIYIYSINEAVTNQGSF